MSLDEKFQAACDRIKKFTKKPQDSEMLELYGLYKQATIGNNDAKCKKILTKKYLLQTYNQFAAEPSDPIGRAKLRAWKGRNGLTADQSKEMYVKRVGELSKKFE